MRRWLAILPFLGLGILAAWVARHVGEPPVLTAGAEMPPVEIETVAGLDTLDAGAGDAIAFFFHSDCGPCLEQFRMLSAVHEDFSALRLYFLTDETELDLEQFARRWPELAALPDAFWGRIHPRDAEDHFRVRFTPTLFVFHNGRFKRKHVGQVVPAVLLSTRISTEETSPLTPSSGRSAPRSTAGSPAPQGQHQRRSSSCVNSACRR